MFQPEVTKTFFIWEQPTAKVSFTLPYECWKELEESPAWKQVVRMLLDMQEKHAKESMK